MSRKEIQSMSTERPTNEEIEAMIEELNASFRRVEKEHEEKKANPEDAEEGLGCS
jgi:signal recognition particle subunit SEC65